MEKELVQVLKAMIDIVTYHSDCENVKKFANGIFNNLETFYPDFVKVDLYADLRERPAFRSSGWNTPPLEKSLKDMGFDFSTMSDNEVKLWYAVGAEIADYSSIGFGIRPYTNSIWLESEIELKKRKINEPEFLGDWELE